MRRLPLFVMLLAGAAWANPSLVIPVPYVETPPVLDGDLSDWDGARWRLVGPDAPNTTNLLVDDGGEPLGTALNSADLSGHFALQWDDDFL